MVPVNLEGKLVRKHACVDGPEIDGHIIDWDKFLPRFNVITSYSIHYTKLYDFSKNPNPRMAELQKKLKAAYPETELMALDTEPNPRLLPDSAFRVRFHSVGGYGTIASGKLLTDILAGVLDMHSKSAPKYGSEKSGAPTNFYIV